MNNAHIVGQKLVGYEHLSVHLKTMFAQGGGTLNIMRRNSTPHILVGIPDITCDEVKTFGDQNTEVRVGIIARGKALIVMFQLGGLTLDLPFNIHHCPTEERDLYTTEEAGRRLLLHVTIVDSNTQIVRSIRQFTMSSGTTTDLLAAVMDQHTYTLEEIEQANNRMQQMPLESLVEMANMENPFD